MKIDTKDIFKWFAEQHGRDVVPESLFREIIREFNQLNFKEITEKGGKIDMGFRNGFVQIIRCKRKGLSPDWGTSNKEKERLIAEGKTPIEYYRDDKGEVIGDNGGEKWVSYHISDYYFMALWSQYGKNYSFKMKQLKFHTSRITSEGIAKWCKENNDKAILIHGLTSKRYDNNKLRIHNR